MNFRASYPIEDVLSLELPLSQYREAGYGVDSLHPFSKYNTSSFIDAGYSLFDLKVGGYSVIDFKEMGFKCKELKLVGFDCIE
jgi:hypothetical protein